VPPPVNGSALLSLDIRGEVGRFIAPDVIIVIRDGTGAATVNATNLFVVILGILVLYLVHEQ